MPPKPTILGFDTSAAHLAAALLSDGRISNTLHEDMKKGQAEALLPALESLLAGIGWDTLDAIAVGIGPGNFTGIRISVAAARGLALALNIPAIGVSSFDVMREGVVIDGPLLVSLPAPRGQVLVQSYLNAKSIGAPDQIDPSAPPASLSQAGLTVIGHDAAQIARALNAASVPCDISDIGPKICRIAARQLAAGSPAHAMPAPLYVRPADAALPSEPPVPILP